MGTLNHLVKGTVVLSVGRVGSYGLSFIRNLILARVLAKADYGLASLFSMSIILLEFTGRMSLGDQIIQAKEGGSTGFQAAAHAFQFVTGLCSSLLILSLSIPIANLFKVPNAWPAFAALAAIPLCQGLGHLDIARRQRDLDYLPSALADLAPHILITALAWPLAKWFGDYRCIVWLMIIKAVLTLVMTFVFAERPYRWSWDRALLEKMFKFGCPLLLNGYLMFGCQQADQLIVGAAFSLEALASYTLSFSLVSIPWFVFAQVASSLVLPVMSRAQDDTVQLRQQYRVCIQVAAFIGSTLTLPIIVSGEQIVTLLYGSKYHGTGIFTALLGAAFDARLRR